MECPVCHASFRLFRALKGGGTLDPFPCAACHTRLRLNRLSVFAASSVFTGAFYNLTIPLTFYENRLLPVWALVVVSLFTITAVAMSYRGMSAEADSVHFAEDIAESSETTNAHNTGRLRVMVKYTGPLLICAGELTGFIQIYRTLAATYAQAMIPNPELNRTDVADLEASIALGLSDAYLTGLVIILLGMGLVMMRTWTGRVNAMASKTPSAS